RFSEQRSPETALNWSAWAEAKGSRTVFVSPQTAPLNAAQCLSRLLTNIWYTTASPTLRIPMSSNSSVAVPTPQNQSRKRGLGGVPKLAPIDKQRDALHGRRRR